MTLATDGGEGVLSVSCPPPAPVHQLGIDPPQIKQLRLIDRPILSAGRLQRRRRHQKRAPRTAHVARRQLFTAIGAL